METDVEKIEGELQQARQDLYQTIEAVEQKVESELSPLPAVRDKPYTAMVLMGGLGFAAGMRYRGGLIKGALFAGALLGLAMRSSHSGKDIHA